MMQMRFAILGFVLLMSAAVARGAVSSSSLIDSPDHQYLYSADFDTGNITRISLKDPKQRIVRKVGDDIRRLALDPQHHLLAATDYRQEDLILVNAKTLSVNARVHLPKRPFGVVYDARNQLFWVTLFQSGELVGIDEDGKVRYRQHTADTPRGMALLSDGRLLITHSMTGQVSIYNTTKMPPSREKLITLATTQDPDQTVSQGLPRRLDDIAVSPDEKVAWLPHVLWNFDHPFQFQSTVFPAISVLSLQAGKEREIPSWRKQLFKQINLQNVRNRTLIMSNPTQAAFSPNGNKVYVTMAGSEDVLVFDRSRSLHDPSKLGPDSHDEGAKAVQLVRTLPGSNPRGLIVEGNDIYVQNAMSLDITQLTRGGDSPFARARVTVPQWAKLMDKDPLPAEIREGERIFNDADTSKHPLYPMAGDSWMSCDSCHVDGFNFTNRYLMAAAPRNIHDNAITGHATLKHMVGGDFIGDYIRMIQSTQGGLGQDTRDQAKPVDPDHPPDNVRRAMEALHAYVTRPFNLPFVSTWLRVDGVDGQGKFVHPQSWINSASCADCHSAIYKQWVDSNHHYMSGSNPYYSLLEDIAGKTEGNGFRAWCLGCHDPERLSVGAKMHGKVSHMFDKGGQFLKHAGLHPAASTDEGTSCLFCHRITRIDPAGGNADFTVNLKDRPTYPGENSSNALFRWFGEQLIQAKPQAHVASYSQPFYSSSQFCGRCHEEFSPGPGARIVGTYEEWAKSSFNAPDDPSRNRTCIDCHMHADISRIGKPVPGYSTDGGRLKKNVVTHQFTGANYFLAGLRNPHLAEMSLALLRTSARLGLSLDKQNIVVRVTNVGAGHKLPTGVSDFRQFWLEVTVKDASGKVILANGQPGADGQVPDNARQFRKVLGDKDGKPVGLEFWRYAKMLEDTRIPADGHRDERYPLPTDVQWPIQVTAKLMYRIYPVWVTRLVQQKNPSLPTPGIKTLNTIEQTFGAPHAD